MDFSNLVIISIKNMREKYADDYQVINLKQIKEGWRNTYLR